MQIRHTTNRQFKLQIKMHLLASIKFLFLHTLRILSHKVV